MTKEQLKEEAKKEFDYFDDSLLEDGTIANIEICLTKTQSYALKDFVDSQIDKAYEEGNKSKKQNLDNMVEAMRNEMRLDNDIVISEGRLRDYIEKYFIN